MKEKTTVPKRKSIKEMRDEWNNKATLVFVVCMVVAILFLAGIGACQQLEILVSSVKFLTS